MRAVAQRVSSASVSVSGEVVGEVGQGFLLLVGVGHDDTEADAHAMADKVAALRVFADDDDKMNRSIADVGGGVLVVSQFTLLGDVRRGNRPSFTAAAPPQPAEELVATVAQRLAEHGVRVATGRFGAMMTVSLVNEGPVTILLETHQGRIASSQRT